MPAPHPRMHGLTHVPGGPDPIPVVAASPSAYTLVGSVTLVADAPLIIGSGQPITMPLTYRDLIIVIVGRSALAAAIDFAYLVLNNDTGSVYDQSVPRLHGGTTWANDVATTAPKAELTTISAASNSAAQSSSLELTLYAVRDTTVQKAFICHGANVVSGATPWWSDSIGHYQSAAAITKIEIQTGAAAPNYWKSGTRMDVYGRGTQ